MRDLELYLFFSCFSETNTKNEAAVPIANTLKRAPNRKGAGGRKKRKEVGFSADEIENGNRLTRLKKEEDTTSFDEM